MMSGTGQSNRIDQFKNRGMMKTDEIRRRREDVTVELRKQKKEESLAKRRNLVLSAADEADLSDDDETTVAALGGGVGMVAGITQVNLLLLLPLLFLYSTSLFRYRVGERERDR
jgi:hypothetical protein